MTRKKTHFHIYEKTSPVHLCFVVVVVVVVSDGGKYEKTRAGCRSRKQIIDSREGKKGREWVV